MLVSHLPPESATTAALRRAAHEDPELLELAQQIFAGPKTFAEVEGEQWSRLEQLVASLRDELHLLRWLTQFELEGRRPSWDPAPLERPGVHVSDAVPRLTTEQSSALAAHLARTQGDGEVTYH